MLMTDGSKDFSVEWDPEKNEQNIKKHGIGFATARLVFADINRIEYFDSIHSVTEDRFVVIGLVHDVLFVVYTMRGETIRLISARLATATERKVYYGR